MANILLVVFVVFDLLELMPEDFAHLMRLHLLACGTLRNTKAVVVAFEAERRPTILDGVPPTAATDTRYEPVAGSVGSVRAPCGCVPCQSRYHSPTLMCMSWIPQDWGFFSPTGCVGSFELSPYDAQSPNMDPLSPKLNCPVVPTRHVCSHSASG